MHPTIKYFAVYVGKQLVWVAQFLISTRLQINHNDEAVINTTFFQMPNKQVEQKKGLATPVPTRYDCCHSVVFALYEPFQMYVSSYNHTVDIYVKGCTFVECKDGRIALSTQIYYEINPPRNLTHRGILWINHHAF